MFWTIIFWLIIVFFGLCMLPISSRIMFDFHYHQPLLTVYIYFLGIRIVRRKIDLTELNQEESVLTKYKTMEVDKIPEQLHKDVRRVMQHTFILAITGQVFIRYIHIRKLHWETIIGTGDAMHTGMTTGGLWMAKYQFLEVMRHYVKLPKQSVINVTPDFKKKYVNIQFECIISIRIGQTIVGFFKIIKRLSAHKSGALI